MDNDDIFPQAPLGNNSAGTNAGSTSEKSYKVQSELSLQDKWRLILGKRVESELPLNKDQEWKIGDCDDDSGSRAKDFKDRDDSDLAPVQRRYYLKDVDDSLDYIYQSDEETFDKQGPKIRGGKEDPSLIAAKWLTTSRRLFPEDVYEVLQKDALKRNKLFVLLQDDDFVSKLEPNMNLLTSILSMHNNLNGKALDNAKLLVNKVVEQLKDKFKMEAQRAFYGKRDLKAQPVRTFRNLDIKRIVRANLKHYQPDGHYIIPQNLFFRANSIKRSLHHIIVLVDQSGSMLDSYAHASILASVFAKLPCLNTHLICYSTELVDYSEYLDDVLTLLFKAQLGGGTDTCIALSYAEKLITEPKKTVVVLISDLFDSNPARMLKMSEAMISSGVNFIVLPAIGESSPSYCRQVADQYASLGAHVGCMTPERLIDFVSQIVSRN